jgi:hypothetical protein
MNALKTYNVGADPCVRPRLKILIVMLRLVRGISGLIISGLSVYVPAINEKIVKVHKLRKNKEIFIYAKAKKYGISI